MGAGNQTGQSRTEAGIGGSESLSLLWQELIAVTQHMAELDLNDEDAPRSLQDGQRRQSEIRDCIDSLMAKTGLSSLGEDVQICLSWERQLQERLHAVSQQYREQYHDLKQGHRLREAYNKTAAPDAYFVYKSQ